jgi:hypothetical protein
MSLDARIETVTRPMLGCHSDLDKYKTSIPPCDIANRNTEKACMWCARLTNEDKEMQHE